MGHVTKLYGNGSRISLPLLQYTIIYSIWIVIFAESLPFHKLSGDTKGLRL